MKMPDRPGGAGGSLVRANLFDAEDTPAFSRTRHGANTIHKRNGDLVVTRDAPAGTEPPWLVVPYSYDTALGRPFEMLLHRTGLAGEDRYDQADGTAPAGQTSAVALEYVGDGWLLELYQTTSDRALHLRLRATDDLDGMVDLGVTISAFAEGFPFRRGVCLCALGWMDEANGYAFAAYYFDTGTGAYTCKVGSTTKKAIIHTTAVPDSPSADGWWTPAHFVGQNGALIDYGYGKCYAVGQGHMLALLIPREAIEYGKDAGVPQTAPVAGHLSPTGAPQLIRSRDFGQTWALEPAAFLAEDGVYKALVDIGDPGGATYDVPARLCAWASNFFACPLGGGRVALAAGGKSTAAALEFDPASWPFSVRAQTLRFFVSGPSGTGFANRPWPLDAGRNYFPVAPGAPTPGTATIVSPLFGFTDTNQWSLGTLGPGTFFVLAEQVTRTVPAYTYGAYPSAAPLLAYVTRDYGATWATEQIPAAALPFAQSYYESKAAWAPTTSPVVAGDGTQLADSTWLLAWLQVCVVTASTDGLGGEVAFYTGELRGPLELAVTSGDATFAGIKRAVTLERSTLWTPHPDRVVGIPRPIYTGDPLSVDYPESVRVGYPEFEDRT